LELNEIISDSLAYALKTFSDIGKLVVLVVLNVVPIVNFVVLGYYYRAIRESPASSDIPELNRYSEMWFQGLKVVVASFLYMLIPVTIIVAGALTVPVSFWFRGFRFSRSLGATALTMIFIGLALMLLISVVMALGVTHMAKNDSLGKAFAFGEIMSIIGKIGWGKYLLWLLTLFVCSAIFGVVGGIPLVGWLISLALTPAFGLFTSRSAALIYSEVVPLKPRETAEPSLKAGRYCQYCGAENVSDAVYCKKCGKKIG